MKKLILLLPMAFVISGCCDCGQVIKENITETRRSVRGLEIRLKGDVAFETMSSELKDAAILVVDKLGKGFVRDNVKGISVIGHTDNHGTEGYNDRLSNDRALAVKTRLVAQGVKASIITTEGQGFKEPIATNDTEEGRAKNRRVEILVQE